MPLATPTINPTYEQDINYLLSVVLSNLQSLEEKIFITGITGAGISTPKVSIPPLVQLFNNVIVPTTNFWEGTWSEHPNDPENPTMRGVFLHLFKSGFDSLFISTGIPEVVTAATTWNRKYSNWKNNNDLAKQLLYILAGNEKISGLYLGLMMANPSFRYPIAIMSEDPFLGYFFGSCCWGSGAEVFSSQNANFDGLVRSFGWNGQPSSWAPFICSLGDRTPELATQALLYRYNHIMKISREGLEDNKFQESWIKRLMKDDKSELMTLVIVNELFNLNGNAAYQLSPTELSHLNRKAEIYKKLTIEIPG